MDISSKFSLVDFLAYLFPGITGTLGLFLLLLLTPLRPFLVSMPIDLATGVLLLALSYVIGVIFSGFAEVIIQKRRAQRKPLGWAKTTMPVPGFEEETIAAFGATFGGSEGNKVEWSSTHFYLCRSMVFEFMPGLAQRVQRQSSIRQLRMNLIPAITIWSIAGVAWGVGIITDNPFWGYTLITGSVILWFPVVGTVVNRMDRNERREVREVLTAFLAGYKKGLFREKKEPESK